jgi:hypothetical protein
MMNTLNATKELMAPMKIPDFINPYRQMRALKTTHKLVSTYAVANDIELTPALDKLVRLGIKADKAQKGIKKK